ncbi:AraC family transcriptional regulator [Sphingobium estronivorans]|uniref:AraC family transcriptional regulator n=1 Tax=Sphingobium estronivorans TaxID=1577690 RepID=UPI0012390BCD|nr:AraC family transcriptional regulator [Sphingobium estronivorans]
MVDPVAEIVALLQPTAPLSKMVSGKGRWSTRRSGFRQPFFCLTLEGSGRLAVDGHDPIILQEGDFTLIPSGDDFTMSDLETVAPETLDVSMGMLLDGEVRHGIATGAPDVRYLVGYCIFGSPDAALLLSLLPQLVHIRGEARLSTLVQLVAEEARGLRPAREVILARLLEVLLIEALRSTAGTAASPGLLRGLADERLAQAIRSIHESPARRWTIAEMAKRAALSRSAFFERFSRAVGVAPMEYLLAWRMAMAKELLRRSEGDVGVIAERVGYGSASAFSVAFSRHVGLSPTQYARGQMAT